MGAAQTTCCAAGDNYEVADDVSRIQNHFDLVNKASQEQWNSEDVQLVKKTWGQAAALGVENVGVLLFRHIFSIAPEALALFKFKNEPNVRQYNSPGLKEHGVRVITVVDQAVQGLDDMKALAPVLQELAIRHAGYGVKPPHFVVVGKALMLTLEDGLKGAFTERVQFAWAKVWHFISSTMIKAMPVEPAPAKAPNLLTKAEVDAIQGSWKKAAGLGVEAVGVLLFKHIFEIAPGALQMFPFKDEPEPLESPLLKAHATKVVETVCVAVDGLDDVAALVPVLKGLGKKHVGYGVKPPHYDVVGQALLKTLMIGLDREFTTEMEAAWTKLWKIIATTMKGTNYP